MTLKMHEIRELIRLIDESSIDEFELEKDGEKVAIKKAKAEVITQQVTAPAPFVPQAAPQAVAPAQVAETALPAASTPAEESTDSNLHKIVSPMVGTFYRASSPDADPYVKEGDTINSNTVVCIVEAMKLMNELEAEVSGTIEKVLVENGQLVEYGQPLFLVKPS
ncbi:acetyl-CoA carboxylase biotin carboxyl carrier protein [Shimazuella sp. AN120528]|uniref:acetyl-CoA carboxylase biotin carboxyl carrier protein n=1 Tax=Shimazuella soli TaxID=1892854 RepID=UPI001F0CECDA|nr:acetyl-CoA carboxylase biotin carboxyl carrier protein [Shimazuella soli]MCH5584195.1 acetyl-CoA carboxylase biotin carboxyl carrier protein [Shimazuella soli]